MSNTVRTIAFATAFVAAAGASFAARQSGEQIVRNPLALAMFADTSGAGVLEFRITNNSAQALKVPYWELPIGSGEGRMFDVLQDGKRATYLGALVKRPPASDADMVEFQAYETKVFHVDLAKDYDLSRGGDYTVSFHSQLNGTRTASGRKVTSADGRMAGLRSAPVLLWVDGDSARKQQSGGNLKASGKPGSGGVLGADGVTYVGCSATQQSGAAAGVAQARAYSEEAKTYVNANGATPRYTTWFGVATTTRVNTIKSHFTNIDTALDQRGGQVKVNCGCNQNYYAYVYPNKPYEIFVCRAFWTAPTAGTDSKGGTLIHETSHFDIVANTDDNVYGQSGAKSLAISNPDAAVANADSHEYYAENTPFQN
jgi:peptidyl-Lys metalloendopeptidase